MKALVTCLILTVFAVCNASPPFQHLLKKLEYITPPGAPRTRMHETLDNVIQYAEQAMAGEMVDMVNDFCGPRQETNWEGVWNETKVLTAAIDVEAETLCSLVTNHIEPVLEPFWSRLDQCGSAYRTGPLGRSMVLVIKSVAEHVCSITGDQIFEHFNLCAFKGTFTAPQCNQFKHKWETLSSGQTETTDTYVNEICHTLPLAKDCLMEEIGQNCKLDFTKKAWEDLFNAILSPCSGIH